MQTETATPLQQRFDQYTKLLDTKGAFAGTGHRRITIPKSKITEQDLSTLGFEPVKIAIPEAGQDRLESFRHPDNNYHLHSHNDRWTIHQDSHPAMTMLMKRQGALKSFIQGAPHVITEGIPGLGYYLAGQISGRKSTADVVDNELMPDVKEEINKVAFASGLLRKLAAVHETRRKMKVRGFYEDPSPGVYDLKGKFEDAARSNAAMERSVATKHAALEVLARYGFHGVKRQVEEAPDPMAALVEVFRDDDFGLDENGQVKAKTKFRKSQSGGDGSDIQATMPLPMGGFW